jgi:hypothetical protein
VNVLKIMGSSGECGFSALTTVAATKVISIPTTMIDAPHTGARHVGQPCPRHYSVEDDLGANVQDRGFRRQETAKNR